MVAVATSSPTANDYAKAQALKAFGHDPEIVKIIECETQFRHFKKDGTIVTNFNKNGTFDVGIMQINSIWGDESLARGIDMNTVEGNIELAKVILRKQGKKAWVCHNP